MTKKFAVIGAAGYIAPRHFKAIQDTGNELVAALDPSDSVGVMDSFFPDTRFFVEYERFDRHLDKLRRRGDGVDYVSICSPNYLHDAHVRLAIRNGSTAICEKPLVLNPWNIDGLKDIEEATGRKVYTILQLRLHPSIIALREKVQRSPKDRKFDVDLSYITARGRWYHVSWKGDDHKSGGVATNIGVHFFDMLHFVFGDLQENIVHHADPSTMGGYLEYEHARVRWFLSVNEGALPERVRKKGQRTYRSITIDREEIEFSGGFTDLHTRSYEEILTGNGFGLDENRVAIETVADIRNMAPCAMVDEMHPLLREFKLTKEA